MKRSEAFFAQNDPRPSTPPPPPKSLIAWMPLELNVDRAMPYLVPLLVIAVVIIIYRVPDLGFIDPKD